MYISTLTTTAAYCLSFSSIVLANPTQSSKHGPTENVDVVIVGGGSSGMYAATRLHQAGKTVAVVESRNKVGGHVDTYRDPISGGTTDVGVQYYHNISVVTNFAQYVGINLTAINPEVGSGGSVSVNADFATGTVIPAGAGSAGNLTAALQSYAAIISQWPFLVSGLNLPSPVPADLVLSWGDFVAKHNLGAAAAVIDAYGQGYGQGIILNTPAIYVIKSFGLLVLESLATTFLTTAAHDNQALFDAAAAKIGSHNIFLSSSVTHVTRSNTSVTVSMKTPTGVKQIKAKKMLITAPPMLSTLQRFLDLDENECSIFGSFAANSYYDAVIRNSGIPSNESINNVNITNQYGALELPAIYTFGPSGLPNLQKAYYAADGYVAPQEVSKVLLSTVHSLAGTLGFDASKVEIAYLRNHYPFALRVSADEIKGGFYGRLDGLQGTKSTWYTGAAFDTQDSGSLWLYTETEILPALLA